MSKYRRIPLPMSLVADLKAIYDSLPTIACQRKCWHYCCWPPRSVLEQVRINNHLGREERGLDLREVKCPQLSRENLCKVRDLRPLICRLWGVAEGLECPHGCVVTGTLLTREQAFALQDQVLALDQRLRGES